MSSRPVATRERLRAYQDRESVESLSLAIRGPLPLKTTSWFSTHWTARQAAGKPGGRVKAVANRVERDRRAGSAGGLADRRPHRVPQARRPDRVEAGAAGCCRPDGP